MRARDERVICTASFNYFSATLTGKLQPKVKFTVENFAVIKIAFLLEVKHVISMDEIPAELVINFDQTGLNVVPTSDWTMEVGGAELR